MLAGLAEHRGEVAAGCHAGLVYQQQHRPCAEIGHTALLPGRRCAEANPAILKPFRHALQGGGARKVRIGAEDMPGRMDGASPMTRTPDASAASRIAPME